MYGEPLRQYRAVGVSPYRPLGVWTRLCCCLRLPLCHPHMNILWQRQHLTTASFTSSVILQSFSHLLPRSRGNLHGCLSVFQLETPEPLPIYLCVDAVAAGFNNVVRLSLVGTQCCIGLTCGLWCQFVGPPRGINLIGLHHSLKVVRYASISSGEFDSVGVPVGVSLSSLSVTNLCRNSICFAISLIRRSLSAS